MPGPRPLPALPRRAFLSLAALAVLPLSACSASSPPVPGLPLRLGTGPEGAVYREIGQAYAALLQRRWDHGRVVDVVHTEAAVDNALRLDSAEIDVGFVNADVADAHRSLRALARVFDSVLHVVVPADSSVRSLDDLDGRPVATGLELSGTRYTSERILGELGIDVDHHALSQDDGAQALHEGRVDALISLTGMPTPAIGTLNASRPARLIDLSDVLGELVPGDRLAYFPVTVPSTMYEGLGSAVTLGVPTLLASTGALDDDAVRFLLEVLFTGADELALARPEAGQISPRTAAATTPVPLHPAARDWFRENKP